MHGNEPAGALAARRIATELERRALPLRGHFVALTGNRAALERGERFIDRDLNRIWTSDRIDRMRRPAEEGELVEEREMRELLAAIDREIGEAPGPVVLLDLHSTSAGGSPFTILADTLQNRALAEHLPIPMILGLEERITGPMLSIFTDRGHTAIVVEGGQHDDERTVRNHEAAIWMTLIGAGALELDEVPEAAKAYGWLKDAARGSPGVVEVTLGHPMVSGDGFRMQPDYDNFQRVRRGELLASDREGPIHAPWEGHVLMPLYQGQGEDGFFLAREIPRSWLRFSAWARRSGLHRLLPSLPGIEADPRRDAVVTADARALRPAVRRILRVFGYRKQEHVDAGVAFVRRPEGVLYQ